MEILEKVQMHRLDMVSRIQDVAVNLLRNMSEAHVVGVFQRICVDTGSRTTLIVLGNSNQLYELTVLMFQQSMERY